MSEKIKNILIIAESIDVEDSSGSKANVALIKNLQKAGFHLEVYHYTRKNIKLKGIPCFSIKEKRRSLLFLLSRGERYLRYWFNLKLYRHIENAFGFSFTMLNDSKSIVAAVKELRDFKPDLIITLSKGASFRPHHALLDLPHWHSIWMAYIHDPYPFASYPRPYDYVEPGHQQKRKFFLQVAKKAKYAAYPSQFLAEWMESYYPLLKGKAVIIPHQIDKTEKFDSEVPEFFKEDIFTVVHAGALMDARNPLGLVKAFKNFLVMNPDAQDQSQLLFLGKKSAYSEKFKQFRKNLPQLYNSDGYISFSTVQNLQKKSAVNVILEAKGPVSPFLPGKFPHCVMADKPILLLGPYYSESRRLLGDNYPYWSEIDDISKITELLQELYNDWIQQRNLTLNRKDLLDYLSSSHLRKVLNSLN